MQRPAALGAGLAKALERQADFQGFDRLGGIGGMVLVTSTGFHGSYLRSSQGISMMAIAGEGMAALAPADAQMLDALQRTAFDYFLKQTHPGSGLVADTSRPGSPSQRAPRRRRTHR